MYGIQDKINQILRGAETIRKNQSMTNEVAKPFGCKCQTLSERLVGDGCDECNKALVIEMLIDERNKLEIENTKLRQIIERYRVWATSENPTQMELDNLKQKYDELN